MMLAVGRELIEQSMLVANSTPFRHEHNTAIRNVLRITLVVLLIGAAYAVEHFAGNAFYNVVSLVGGLGGFPIGFIYPPAMYMRLFWPQLSRVEVAFNVALILLAIVLTISSTLFAVLAFIG